MGVGTGCVIDLIGNTSRQVDLILYEKSYCPVFTIADNVSYYPCESVIAAGSVKSDIKKDELENIYENLASVRRLKKFTKPAKTSEVLQEKVACRTYLDKNTQVINGCWETIQNSTVAAQIYTFGYGQRFSVKDETLLKHARDLCVEYPDELRPNVVLTTDHAILAPGNGQQMSYSALGCSGSVLIKPTPAVISLEYLLVCIFSMIQNGITAPGNVFEKYFVPPPMDIVHYP